MEYRQLGNTGVRVSKLCFGTMSFGSDADENTSEALYRRCRAAGINIFDCANVYSGGKSEQILGRLIADERADIVLTTKAYFPTSQEPNARGSSQRHLITAVEDSLRRLGTDYIDLFFLHRWDDQTDLEQTLRGVERLVQQGKILYPAASNFAAWQVSKALGIQRMHGWSPFCAVQPMYNLLKRQAEVEILPMAADESQAIFSYSPLAGGLLSGKYGASKRPDQGRLIDNKMYKTRYGAEQNYQIADQFVALAKELGHHPASLAIAWVAAHPNVTAPIIGARSVEQLEPCLAAAEIEIDADLRQRIGDLSPTPPPATDRNEETSSHNYGALTATKRS